MTCNTHDKGPVPIVRLLQLHKQEKKLHRELVSKAKARLQDFIKIIEPVPFRDGIHTLSMDLLSLFELFCGFDLPEKFNIEFGRQITKACLDGRLRFERKTFGRASLAGFKGLDVDLVVMALRKARHPAA